MGSEVFQVAINDEICIVLSFTIFFFFLLMVSEILIDGPAWDFWM